MDPREAAQKERLKASLARLMEGRSGASPADVPREERPRAAEPAASGKRREPSAPPQARPSRPAAQRLAELHALGSQGPGEPLDLSGVELRRRDLSGLDLSFVKFVDADLSQANLAGATLLNADLAGATLYQATLDGAELTGSDLSGANLDRVRGPRACFGMTSLVDASLFEADLTGATLSKADLTGADLRSSCLRGARLREAELLHTCLERADLQHVDLEHANVDGTAFDEADLRGAKLRGITGFEHAHWIGTDLRDVDFTGAYLVRRFATDQNYLEEFRNRSRFSRFVYVLWKVTSDCGRSVTRWTAFTLLVAVAFAFAFHFAEVDYGEHATPLSPLYFSVITLTTLGYGDVLPTSVPGQVLAMLEVITGYLLMGGMLSIFANKMARRAE